METEYIVEIRLQSDAEGLQLVVDKLSKFDIVFSEKGKPVRLNSLFKAERDVLIIRNQYCGSEIKFDKRLLNLLEQLDGIFLALNISPQKEVYVIASIRNDRFGFVLLPDDMAILCRYGYSFSLSGTCYL